MDWNREDDDDRQARTLIVELLVSLAFLADCACSRSRALRRLILMILGPAEAYARNIVLVEARAASGAITDLPVPMRVGDSVADAMRLAACFRALAMAVQNLSVRPSRFMRWLTPRHTPLRRSARILLDMSNEPAFTPRFDTS